MVNKKKLVGTIIGVLMFAALIVGATYAWLTFNATVTGGNYNAKTGNFVVNYTKGTNITALNQLDIATASAVPTTEGVQVIEVKAGKKLDNDPNGKITIKLNTTANGLSTGVIKYATSIDDAVPTTINSLTTGTSDINIITDYTLNSTTQTSFKVYFWLDSATITNTDINKTYAGYIYAEAVQIET